MSDYIYEEDLIQAITTVLRAGFRVMAEDGKNVHDKTVQEAWRSCTDFETEEDAARDFLEGAEWKTC